MNSIRSRLLVLSLAVLVLFMILTALALERAVVQSMREAEEDLLRLQVYNLLAAVERDVTGSSIDVADERLFESRLFSTDSGLYGVFYNDRREEIWRSLSTEQNFPFEIELGVDQWSFRQVEFEGQDFFHLAFGIQWPDVLNRLNRFSIVVWEDAEDFNAQLQRFRQTLWSWLAVTLVLLIGVIYAVLGWGLRPLKTIGRDIKAVEQGDTRRFEGEYPAEIRPLTENLNALLHREQHQKQRYQHALDDLAHSLKTPLAVMRGVVEGGSVDEANRQTLAEQTTRMDDIVAYQLQKAGSVGPESIHQPVDLVPNLDKLVKALGKVYTERGTRFSCHLPEMAMVRFDEGDLLEICGNLLDNACKYGKRQVIIDLKQEAQNWLLEISDDGPGLPAEQIEVLLRRGARLDESVEGQGIGLAVVADLCQAYDVSLAFAGAETGGLKVSLGFAVA